MNFNQAIVPHIIIAIILIYFKNMNCYQKFKFCKIKRPVWEKGLNTKFCKTSKILIWFIIFK